MDKIIKFKINGVFDGKTVKQILCANGFSSTIVRRMKRTENGIMLNGESVHTDRRVRGGDELEVTVSDKPSENIVPKAIPIDIIYEDDDILAVNKPRAMPTHPSHNHHEDTLANGIMYYYGESDFTFRAVMRLDADTSGIVLIAKNAFAARILNDDMKNKRIHKEYVAVVNGVPIPRKGRISVPIKRFKNSVILRCAAPDGKESVTDYEVEKTVNGMSFVRLFPLTGRTHQLRVHMSHIGAPIYGDDLYGAPQIGERTRLHCRKIIFRHPMMHKETVIEAAVPNDITDLICGG